MPRYRTFQHLEEYIVSSLVYRVHSINLEKACEEEKVRQEWPQLPLLTTKVQHTAQIITMKHFMAMMTMVLVGQIVRRRKKGKSGRTSGGLLLLSSKVHHTAQITTMKHFMAMISFMAMVLVGQILRRGEWDNVAARPGHSLCSGPHIVSYREKNPHIVSISYRVEKKLIATGWSWLTVNFKIPFQTVGKLDLKLLFCESSAL